MSCKLYSGFGSRRFAWSAVAAGLILAGVGRAPAADSAPATGFDWQKNVTLTLSDRMRGEVVDWFGPRAGNAGPGAEYYSFFGNQFRLGTKVNVPYAQFVAEMQYTAILNLPDDASVPVVKKSGNLGPGALYYANTHDRDQAEAFLKQGYLLFKDVPALPGTAITLGRFEYSDGLETMPKDPALQWLKRARIGERLIGPFGYTHVTRSFDGGRVAWDNDLLNVTAVGFRPTMGGFEISANRELDIAVAGVAATLKRIENLAPLDARVFYMYYEDDRDIAKVDNRSLLGPVKDTGNVSIHTWGAHALTVVDAGPGKVDGLVWGAAQEGSWGDLNHLAYAYAVEGGYQFPKVFAAPWFRVGYNASSGDGDPSDHKHYTFFQLLPTARLYAQTPFYNLMNSQDLFVQTILKPHARLLLRLDGHWLRANNRSDLWYSGGGATNDSIFGYQGLATGSLSGTPSGFHHELAYFTDLSAALTISDHYTAYLYYGHMFGQGAVRSTFDGPSANYTYVEVTYRY